MVSVKRTSEGFNELNFSLGVFNCFFIVFMFGKHPEHFWLVYLVQGSVLIPRKFYSMWTSRVRYRGTAGTLRLPPRTRCPVVKCDAGVSHVLCCLSCPQPLNQALYYLDFCWCMNFTALAVIALLLISGLIAHDDGMVSQPAREALFNALLGVSIGTLMGAVEWEQLLSRLFEGD